MRSGRTAKHGTVTGGGVYAIRNRPHQIDWFACCSPYVDVRVSEKATDTNPFGLRSAAQTIFQQIVLPGLSFRPAPTCRDVALSQNLSNTCRWLSIPALF